MAASWFNLPFGIVTPPYRRSIEEARQDLAAWIAKWGARLQPSPPPSVQSKVNQNANDSGIPSIQTKSGALENRGSSDGQ